ncbi:MAG: hypothetical protein ACKV22_08105 [Bryobacteraceae bacterium]
MGELGSGGGEDLFGFVAGEFVADAEGIGEAVNWVEFGSDQIVGALAESAQVAAGFAPVGAALAEPEHAQSLGRVGAWATPVASLRYRQWPRVPGPGMTETASRRMPRAVATAAWAASWSATTHW